jgi:hypothetical protein
MRTATSKSKKVRDYFTANPDAKATEVGKKFKCAMPVVYKIRKEVLEQEAAKPVAITPFRPFKPSSKARDTQIGGDHYKNMGIEPWDVVDTWPHEQRVGYYRGGALKYLMRMGSKDESPMEIAKGKHYMQKLLEVVDNPS